MSEVADLLRDREELDDNPEYVDEIETLSGTDRLNARAAALHDTEMNSAAETCDVVDGRLRCESDNENEIDDVNNDVEVFDVTTESVSSESNEASCGTDRLNARADMENELDNDVEIMVVRNPPSDIFGGTASPMPRSPGSQTPYGSNITPLREQRSCQQRLNDSFTRLFGPDSPPAPAQPAKIERRSSLGRNPVTGDGVQSWDSPRSVSRATTPRILRNPVTGEGLSGPASTVSTPAKPMSNGHVGAILNGTA